MWLLVDFLIWNYQIIPYRCINIFIIEWKILSFAEQSIKTCSDWLCIWSPGWASWGHKPWQEWLGVSLSEPVSPQIWESFTERKQVQWCVYFMLSIMYTFITQFLLIRNWSICILWIWNRLIQCLTRQTWVITLNYLPFMQCSFCYNKFILIFLNACVFLMQM